MTPRARPVAVARLVGACLAVVCLAIPFVAADDRPGGGARFAAASPPTTTPAQRWKAPDLVFTPAPPAVDRAQVAVDAAQAAVAPSTQLGVAVLDRATGEAAVGGRGEEPFYTASLSKLVVTVDVLDRRRTEGLIVTGEDLDLVRRALGPSDDSAMNALWVRFDGPGAAARVSADLELTGTTAPADPSQWGEMSVPATDYLRLYDYVLDVMPADDRAVVIDALSAAPPIAADGFDQAFGLLDPVVDGPGAAGAQAKQGWMCCFSGVYYLHSAGIVGPDQRFVVVVLTRVPSGPGWDPARAQVTAAAAAAVQALG